MAVFGIMADKDLEGVLAPLLARVGRWFVVDLPGERAAPAAELASTIAAAARAASNQGGAADQRSASGPPAVSTHPTPRAGLAAARRMAGPDDRIVAFGSFLTVADILADAGLSSDADAN